MLKTHRHDELINHETGLIWPGDLVNMNYDPKMISGIVVARDENVVTVLWSMDPGAVLIMETLDVAFERFKVPDDFI